MSLGRLPDILRALADEHVDYILIGAVAVLAHGLVRTTEHSDFFARPDPQNVARLRTTLGHVFPEDPAIIEISGKIWPDTIRQSASTSLTVLLRLTFINVWESRFPTAI